MTSNIGKNIKKIRSLKKLSQAGFAEIFDITRGSVGAYEEGRAEPKIATIIQIANYFGISIDLLLNKELSVSDLYSFDILNKKLDVAHKFTKAPEKAYRKGGIGLVRVDNYLEYVVNYKNKDFVSNLPYIELPVNFKGSSRAFELNGSEMEYNHNGLHHGDILLAALVSPAQFKIGNIYAIVTADGIITRRLQATTTKSIDLIADDPNYPTTSLKKDEILEAWQVKGAYTTYLNPPKMLDERILMLENRMLSLEDKITRPGKKK